MVLSFLWRTENIEVCFDSPQFPKQTKKSKGRKESWNPRNEVTTGRRGAHCLRLRRTCSEFLMPWVLGQVWIQPSWKPATACFSNVAQLGRQIDGTMTLGLVEEGWRKQRAQITPWRSTVQNYRDETGDNFLAVLWVFSSHPLTIGLLHLEVTCLWLINKHFCGALIISQVWKTGALAERLWDY